MFADERVKRVLAGMKTATSSVRLAYEMEGEVLPAVGTYSVILLDNDEAACIIRDTKASVVPFHQVSPEHAYKEGEDDPKNGARSIAGPLPPFTKRPGSRLTKTRIASWQNLKWSIMKSIIGRVIRLALYSLCQSCYNTINQAAIDSVLPPIFCILREEIYAFTNYQGPCPQPFSLRLVAICPSGDNCRCGLEFSLYHHALPQP